MSLLDRLKELFARDEIPEEAKRVFDRATTPKELLRGLDELLTTNEVEFKDLERELERLEERERAEIARIREGAVEGRQKRNALLSIQRLRKQMDNYESRLRIYDRNMTLHLGLIGKIQEIEAMKLRGVDETRIDRIVMEFEEQLEKYNDTMSAADAAETSKHALTAKDDRDLAALEREITGAAPVEERRRREAEAAAIEPPLRRPIEENLGHVRDVESRAEEKPAEAARPAEKKLELE
jgi:hypothetical protein